MNPLEQNLLTLGTGLILSIFTSLVTVRLALRQFYSQKWWEKKWGQYEKILESLHYIRHIDDKLLASVETGRDLSPDRRDSLLSKSREGSDEIERAVYIGAFALPKEALTSLRELRTK